MIDQPIDLYALSTILELLCTVLDLICAVRHLPWATPDGPPQTTVAIVGGPVKCLSPLWAGETGNNLDG